MGWFKVLVAGAATASAVAIGGQTASAVAPPPITVVGSIPIIAGFGTWVTTTFTCPVGTAHLYAILTGIGTTGSIQRVQVDEQAVACTGSPQTHRTLFDPTATYQGTGWVPGDGYVEVGLFAAGQLDVRLARPVKLFAPGWNASGSSTYQQPGAPPAGSIRATPTVKVVLSGIAAQVKVVAMCPAEAPYGGIEGQIAWLGPDGTVSRANILFPDPQCDGISHTLTGLALAGGGRPLTPGMTVWATVDERVWTFAPTYARSGTTSWRLVTAV